MWKRLHHFSALDPSSRTLFLHAIVLLPLVSLSLRFRGFRATHATLQHLPFSSTQTSGRVSTHFPNPDTVARTVQMVRAAVRHGFGSPNCLEISLTLWFLLARQRVPSAIRIGTRKIAGGLEAHAWVENDGVILNELDQGHLHYAPFDAAFSSLADGDASSF
jgi:Transglutaminase-like superfamily